MRKTLFGILIGVFLGSLGVVVAQTPTIFAAIRVNGFSDLRGDIVNNTGDVTVNDNLVVTGTCTGCGGVSFPLLAPDGSDAAPSYSFTNDPDAGLYRIGADDIALGVDGASANSGYLELSASNAFLDGGTLTLQSESGSIELNSAGDVNVNLQPGGTFTVDELIYGLIGDTFPAIVLDSPNGRMQFIPSESGGSRGRINIWDETSTRVPLTLDAESVTFHLGAAGGADSTLSASGFTNNGWNRTSDGNNTVPAYSFSSDTNTGAYLSSADTIGWSTGGVARMTLSSTLALSSTGFSSSGTLTLNGTVTTDNTTADEVGYKGVPQNIQAGNYGLVLTDAATHIYHASGAGAGDTYTIPANASVAYPIGTVLTFINDDSNSLSIAITSDTMTLAGTTMTGTRTLAENGVATAIKVTSTSWIINGTGITAVREAPTPLNDEYYDMRAAA